MNKVSKYLALAALLGGAVLAAEPASAVTCIGTVCTAKVLVNGVSGGTLTLASPDDDLGTITAIKLKTGYTYDFTFTTDATYDVLSQLQASIAGKPATSLNIGFDLYSGLPGSGTFLDSSDFTVGPSLDTILKAGNYYLQVNPGQIVKNMELTSGSVAITAALPEPAAWISMIVGFGAIGGLMRTARRASALNVA
ncbi:MAG TPA: PEPxxWA-CTERM sorting domain-containing protein [Rhizomicrobium sp.]|nr:PEPxxWA-CTERM sorting domain-containing protein [Rhizomicrobium sp.]